MSESIPEFGERIAGVDYIVRPGGYAVVRASNGSIAVVATLGGLYLPGGGQEGGESPADAAVRETLEECGLRVRLTGEIGVADQLVTTRAEGDHYRKRCTFFTAEPVTDDLEESEADHLLCWMTLEEAESRLLDGSQRWAVSIVMSDNEKRKG